MYLKLICSNPDKMTDTNKLLYGIFVLLSEMNGNKTKPFTGSSVNDNEADNGSHRQEENKVPTQAVDTNTVKEGKNCKYCGTFVEGNQGKYLAHVRKCPKRK